MVALVVLSVFILFRRIFARYVFEKVLRLMRRARTEPDEKILPALQGPLCFLFCVLGIYFALVLLPLTPFQDALALRLLRTAIIFVITWGLYNLAGALFFQEITQKLGVEIDRILIPFFSKVAKFIIVALAISIIAQEWGYEISGLVAGLGLGGLAVALAAKDALANIFGGVVIITDKPFTIGDWIATPTVEGTVEDISFRSTRLRTFSHALVTVPNSKLADEAIINWTRMGKRRINFHLRIAYNTPVAKIKGCVSKIRELLQNHPGVHQETIFVHFELFGNNSLDILLYFFTITTIWSEYLKVREDVNIKVMEILESEGVSLAIPGRSIHLETPLQPETMQHSIEDGNGKRDPDQ